MLKIIFILLIFQLLPLKGATWGFRAHEKINRLAVFALPPSLIGFYKYHIQYLTENAVNPDKRRYAVEEEAPRHYLDADVYGDSAVYLLPRYWRAAVKKYTEDTLMAYGIVPWHIYKVKHQLTAAMMIGDVENILRLSADLGHYVGDSNVPLHTTENYNGQLTNQYGIHGFWESRLPELFADDYTLFGAPVAYLSNPQLAAWEAIIGANNALDSVLHFEKELHLEFQQDKIYAFEERNGKIVKTYSKSYATAYHDMLSGMVERQMIKSIRLTASLWYTCWVDAGQPDIQKWLNEKPSDAQLAQRRAQLESWKSEQFKSRSHEH